MDLPGKPLFIDESDFPYKRQVPKAAVTDEAHFVIPMKHFAPRARIFDQYNANDKVGWLHIGLLEFMAEAFTNACRWRGSNRPNTVISNMRGEWADRVTIILTYVPREVGLHNGEFLPAEELLKQKNIAALMFSFLVMDEELKIEEMLSDQIDYNRYGMPTFSKKKNRADVDMVSDNEDEEMDFDAAEPADILDVYQAAEPQNVPQQLNDNMAERPGTTYHSLDDNPKYYFPGKNHPEARIDKANQPKNAKMHQHIRSTKNWCLEMGTFINRIDMAVNDERRTEAERFTIAHLPADHPMHHTRMLSLESACERLATCGAHMFFTDPARWHDAGGEFFRPPEIANLDNVVRFPLKHFNAKDLVTRRMPHCNVLDKQIMQPSSVRGVATLIESAERVYDLDQYLGAQEIKLPREEKQEFRAQFVSVDAFNDYFERYAQLEADLMHQWREASLPQDKECYAKNLARWREQGISYYFGLMQSTRGDLPDGYEALNNEIDATFEWTVQVEHLYQSVHTPESVRLTPLSQWRNNELLFIGGLLDVADTTLLLFPKLQRLANTVYLPRMGTLINKENLHVIGAPGTSKSDTVMKLLGLLIEGTYMLKTAGSNQGMLGDFRSQRLLEVYNELPPLLAPTSDLKGQEAAVLQRKLTQLR